MADPTDQVSHRQRRANWVGLKTLRQRPKPAGVLADGEPVYEVRGIRLVLRGQSPYFNRLVACHRCGKDQAGVPVLSAADLDAPLRPMICADCVRKAGVSSVWEPEAARVAGERAAPQAPKPQEPPAPAEPAAAPLAAPPAEATGGGGDRLEALERQLEAMSTRVEQLSRLAVAQETAMEEGRKADEAARTALQTAMTAAVSDARAELAVAAEASATKVAGLAQQVESQRVDINAIVAAVGQVRTDIARVAEANQQLAQAHAEAQQRASSSAEQAAGVQAAVDERIHQLGEQLVRATARIEALVTLTEERAGRVHALEERLERLTRQPAVPVLPEVPGAGSGESARLLESLELQLQGASSRLAALSGSRGTDLYADREGGSPPGGGEHGEHQAVPPAR